MQEKRKLFISLVKSKERMKQQSKRLFKKFRILWIFLNLLIIIMAASKVPSTEIIIYMIISAVLGGFMVTQQFLVEKQEKVTNKYIVYAIRSYVESILKENQAAPILDVLYSDKKQLSVCIMIEPHNMEKYLLAVEVLDTEFKLLKPEVTELELWFC